MVALPITSLSSERVLSQLVRLHLMEPGRHIAAQIESRPGTRTSRVLEEARNILPEIADTPGIQ